MRELKEDTFSESKNKDAHDHVDRVLIIVSLFNILEVSQDAVLLHVFPFTLSGFAKRWVNRLTLGAVNTWDLLKKAFIQSDLLYKCPTHDITSHKKVNIFNKGLNTKNHYLLDLRGPILGMTPNQALMAIQTMADHSQKWHDGTSSKNISSNSNTDGLAVIDLTLTKNVRSTRKSNSWKSSCTVFGFPPYPLNYPTRMLTMEEMLAKFVNEGCSPKLELCKKEEVFSQVKTYLWKEPYAFKLCVDNIMRRCVAGSETLKILAHCHSGPTGGHHSASVMVKKVYESGFYWPSVFKDANECVRRCDACQRSGNISSRNEIPQNNIQ
nr:reverse transcriptase domain-containing protein [Tanacetum cinerariifolium]